MKKLLLLLPLMLLFAGRAHAQVSNNTVIPGQACPASGQTATNTVTGYVFVCTQINGILQWVVYPKESVVHGTGAPVNPCFPGFLYTDDSTGNFYSCNASAWSQVINSNLRLGVPDGNGGNPVTTTPYLVQCDVGNAPKDRNTTIRFQTGASVITVPLSTASGCSGGFFFSLLSEVPGNLTVNATAPDTISVYNGPVLQQTGQTSFTFSTGQFVTMNQGATGLWEARISNSGAPRCSTDTFTATPSYVLNTDECHTMTLTGNVTSISITGTPVNGRLLYLKFPEDGTGGRTVAFPGSFIFPTGFSFHTAANNQNNMGWEFDGTNWRPIVDFGGGGGGGGGTPAGANGAVQIQNGGSFGASGNVFDLNSLFQVNEDQQNKGPNPVGNDIRAFGGQNLNPNAPPGGAGITATCNGTTSISLSSASSFQNGGGISIAGCGPNNNMTTPTGVAVTTNLARVGTATGDITATGLTGATTYNYKIAAQNLGSAITAGSATATITTGPASLGAQTVNLTSCTRANSTVTCLTAATHGLVVNAEVKIRGMSDSSFNVNQNVVTVPDNTHFTYVSVVDTRTGASTSATGGTVVYWNLNHITWSAVTNAYRYLICSDRGSPGTFNLIGISKPSYPGAAATDGSLYFDDFGTVTTYPTPPWPMPSTCPITATNALLTTTIVSGAGTPTITVANAATQTLAGTPARADNVPAYKAAAVANSSGSNIVIPAGNFTNYLTNSILDLSQIAPGVTITAEGQTQNWGDTLIFGNKGGLIGFPLPNVGGGASFAPGSYAGQIVSGAPGIHFAGGNPFGPQLRRVEISGVSNGQTNVVFDNGGPNEGYQVDDVECVNGFSGSVDDMSTCLRFRGSPGASAAFVSKGRLGCDAEQVELNSETPCLYNDATGATIKIEEITMSGRGMLFQGNPAGAQVNILSAYCQACNTPEITVSSAKNVGGGNLFNLNTGAGVQVNDTGSTPLITALNSTGTIQLILNTGFNTGGGTTATYSGVQAQYANFGGNGFTIPQGISSESTNSALAGGGGALDGIFSSGALGGAGAYANKNYNAALSTSDAYPIFVTGPTIAAPTVAPAAGGNLPAIPLFYSVTPAWPNGGTGPNSLVSASITPSGGNLSVTVTWTPLGTAAGCTGYYILRSISSAGGGNITNSGGGFVSGCNTGTYTDSSNISQGAAPILTSGGPTELLPGTKGINTTALDLVNDVTLSTQGGGTAYTVDFPINQPTTGNTFLSCTAANPAVCSWVPGGTGVLWNSIGNPSGALTLAMATNTSTFNFTSALPSAFVWANTTAATVTTSQSSPQLAVCGQAWTGATNTDCWTFQHIIGNGLNAAITDTYGHTGSSTGVVTSTFPGPVAAGVGPGAGGVIIPQGPANATTGAAVTLQGATSITPYNVTLPGAQPTTNGTFLSCSPATQAVCTWSQGGLGVGAGAAAQMGYYLSNSCPVFDPDGFCFNTPANTQYDKTCSWTNASTTVTCTDSPFKAADVGKQVGGWDACATDLPTASYGGAIVTGALVTIATFTDANHVVLSATPANTVAAVSGETCFVWGNPDDAAASAIDTAIQNQTAFCPMLHLAAGGYLFNNPHFGTQPAGCKTIPNLSAGQSLAFGNLGLPGGFRIEGRGSGATIVHLGTNFPGTTTCNQYTYNSSTACFAVPPLGEWKSFQITGDGQANTCGSLTGSPPSNQAFVYASVGGFDHVVLSNFCSFTSGAPHNTGVVADSLTWMDTLNNAAFGDVGLQVKSGAVVYGLRVSIENSPTADVAVNGNLTCTMCAFDGAASYLQNSSANNNGSLTVAANGFVKMFGGELSDTPFASNVSSSNPGLLQMQGNSANARFDNVLFFNSNSVTNTGAFAIFNAGTGTNIQMKDSSLVGFASGHGIQVNAGTLNFQDQGGNTFPSAMATTFFNYNPIAGGSGAPAAVFGNPTNFGTAIGSTTLVADVPGYSTYVLSVSTRQNVLGVGCGAGTNTAQITINWTAPGGTSESITPTLLSISANGVLDTGAAAGQVFSITPGAHTAITYSVASTLASAGCSTVPQYSQVIRVL